MKRIKEENLNTKEYWNSYWGEASNLQKNFENDSPELRDLGNLTIGTILDVGCGSGHHTKYLSGDVTVCDLSENAVKFVQEKLGYKGFVCDVSRGLPEDTSYDTVICTEVLEHVEDPIRLIKELKRVARKRVIVSVPKDDEAKRFEDHVWSFSEDWMKKEFTKVYSPDGLHIIAIYEKPE